MVLETSNGRVEPLSLIDTYKRKVLNQELSLTEFKNKTIETQSMPSKAILELTENCNFRCLMCPQYFEPKYQRYNPDYNMSLEMFDQIAESIFPDAYFVDLRGFGESTILPFWPDILERLEKYPLINWHLVTNMSLTKLSVWEKMVELGFMLGASIDGATKETFDTVRKRGRFEKTLEILECVTEKRASLNNKGFLYFIVTVQRKNIHELPGIVELAAKYKIPEVQFKIVRQFDGFLNHDEMVQDNQWEELTEMIDVSLDLAIKNGIRLTINEQELLTITDPDKLKNSMLQVIPDWTPNFAPPEGIEQSFLDTHNWANIDRQVQKTFRVAENQTCFKPHSFTLITANGRVGTCNHMMSPDIREMGNLSSQSFSEIWNGDEYQVFRRELLFAEPMDPRCNWCFKNRFED